jgi:hypothetical protein
MRAASINDTTRTLIYRGTKVLTIPYSTKLFVRFLTQVHSGDPISMLQTK